MPENRERRATSGGGERGAVVGAVEAADEREDRLDAARAQILEIATAYAERPAKERRARRLLRYRSLQLHGRLGRFCVVDHLGGIRGAPHYGTIDQVLAWIEATA